MIGILGAMVAALGWGTDAVLARQGLRRLPPALGTFLSLCAGLAVCAILLALLGPARYPARAFAWFGLVGLINFLIGRLCNFRATQRLGASRAASIFATAPVFSITLAVLFAGERVTAPLLLGVALIIGGIVLVVRS